MKQPGTYKHRLRCPDCSGHKVKMYATATGDREELNCQTCHGEGLVDMIITISYQPLASKPLSPSIEGECPAGARGFK